MEAKLQHIYAINYAIQKVDVIGYKSLFQVFDAIKNILELDYFVFLEKNPAVPSYITYRYDSRKKGMLLSESFTHNGRSDFASIFSELNISEGGMIQKIHLGKTTQGYFIIGNTRHDRNVTNVIANLLTSIVHMTINNKYKEN